MASRRKVSFPADVRFNSYADWQANYVNRAGELIADTEIWIGRRKVLKINSLACKGNDLVPGAPVAAFFGDSATFGASFTPDSWPARVALKGVQPLNCAIEGIDMERCRARYEAIKGFVDCACVVVYSGWHNIIYNKNEESYWEETLSAFGGDHLLAFCSLATCLTDECRTRGIDALICSDVLRADYANYFEYNMASIRKRYFNFWCNMEPSGENIGRVLDGVRRYNDFLRSFCSRRNHVFIDLHDLLRPASYERIPDDFYDVCHFRPSAYEKVAGFVSNALNARLSGQPGDARARGEAAGVNTAAGDDWRKNIYPLW